MSAQLPDGRSWASEICTVKTIPISLLVLSSVLVNHVDASSHCDVKAAQSSVQDGIVQGRVLAVAEVERLNTVELRVDGKKVSRPFGFAFDG